MEKRFGINFDRFAARFHKNIYGSKKGELRKQILWQHLCETLPLTSQPGMRILDLGCGSAPFAEQLLQQGHELVLCDISASMLQQAQQRLQSHPSARQVQFLQAPLQEIVSMVQGPFDLILAHAVIEWLPEPETLLDVVSQLLGEGGYLSLMFYNRNSLVFRNMQLGNWKRVKNGWLRGRGNKTLTPTNPLDPDELYQQLTAHGLAPLSKAGIRVFYDYLDRSTPRDDLDLLFELEQRYSRREPFLSLARYIHVICRRGGESG